MTLTERDRTLRELMDDPDCDPTLLEATLRRFGTVNRLVSAWGTVYRTHVAPRLAALDRPARVLDIGSGGGDVVSRLAGMARRDRFDVEWTGIDPDPRAHDVAETRARRDVRFLCTDTAALVATGDSFDLVISNHVLHHLGEAMTPFLAESLALSTGAVLHGDIARSALAYRLYALAITPFAPGTFLRTDGLRSIRRSFTPAELQRELDERMPGDWVVETPAPFRLLAVGAGRA